MSKGRKPIVLIILSLVFALIFLFFAVKFVEGLLDKKKGSANNISSDPVEYIQPDENEWGKRIEYEGKLYRKKSGLTTVLLLGIDNTYVESTATSYAGSSERADAINLLVIDDNTKTIRILSISRDAMVPVDVYKEDGTLEFTTTAQITLQYAFGWSPARACYLMKHKVSDLIFGMDVGECLSITMDAIPVIVDGMGGLKLTFDQDYSAIDERYKQGATVTLNGNEAERFVRWREHDVDGSPETRRERHSWLISEMYKQIRALGGGQFIADAIESAADYIQSDVDAETLKKVANYTMTEVINLPGESKTTKHDEYYVDETALRPIIVDLFYEPVD